MKDPKVFSPAAGQSVKVFGYDIWGGNWQLDAKRIDDSDGQYRCQDDGLLWQFIDNDGNKISNVMGWQNA